MEWGPILTAIGGILTPIGLGFGWLIREIVKNSREAVTELKKTLAKTEKERDTWRDRAYEAGWRAKE